jgi:uncharacterized repeat protein (TIGR01451 family)
MRHALAALLVALFSVASGNAVAQDPGEVSTTAGPIPAGPPIELQMKKAGATTIDLRLLPQTPPEKVERPELEEPEAHPVELPGTHSVNAPAIASPPGPSAPAPPPIANFDGLDFATWGAGHPPDTNGDVGPTYFIQTVNTSIGVFQKSDGTRVAAFTFNTLMSQGAFGNLCDTNNFGDPVVLYDTFEDRWVITDFAFTLDGSGNVINPPGSFQCFAVSKTGDPVTGGWNFYSISIAGGLNDYPKFGIWSDGLYMSTNMFNYVGGGFQNSREYAFNKAQMYAGTPTIQVVSFNAPPAEFTLLPANARLQTGTPPPGSPNYYSVVWQFLNVVSVYKFHVDWNSISTSTFTGPFLSLTATNWSQFTGASGRVPSPANSLDTLYPRLMMQNQYTNIGGVESVWDSHTVGAAGATSAQAAVRYYQVKVTGGSVEANASQAFTWSPDATVHRFMPSVAVDNAGDLAIGYSGSNAALNPAIRYAARLATDPVNSITQTETSLIEGTGSQQGNCGVAVCTRWGDYSAMSLDTDGCTFWYTNEYYAVNGLNDLTRVGSFTFPSCIPVASGTVAGTVTATAGGTPLSGVTVALGSRTTTTDGSGFYQFLNIPSGTYPSITASDPGYVTSTVNSIVVTDGATTTQNFSLATAPTSACLVDTTQADFQTGVPTNVDLTTSPGDVILLNAPSIDQQNTTLSNSGVGITTTVWGGQTFTAGVTGQLTKADINLFCSTCTGTAPNLTLSVRATSGNLPTGADLATATLTGNGSGASSYFTGTFASPPTLAAGTTYALVVRPTANPSAGIYAITRSATNVYAGGQRVSSADSGTTWAAPLTAGQTTDAGFRTYMQSGFPPTGNLISSNKDSNLPAGYLPTWSTLSFTASTPANTALAFQIAASNSSSGPFGFVGPDGTVSTFFTTSGASLSQFNGNRYLKYQADLSTTNNTVTPTVNDVTVCFAGLTPPDLSLTKTDGGASVAPGGTVAYTLTSTNSGGQAATGVVLTETVPANTTFNAGASTAGWVCAPDNNAGSTCTLAAGTVAGGGSQAATYAVTVVNPVAAGVSQISNTASVADDGTHGADATPADNTASDTTPVTGAPDLSITKDDGGASVAPGGTVTYTLTYANSGNRGATGVVITETVPANTTSNAGASSAGWVCSPDNNAGSTCTLAIGGLVAGGGNQTATYAATVANPLAAGVSQISNTATIADDGTNGTDPTPANNSGSDTTPITGAPDLSLTKSDGGASVAPGGTVAYTLTYANSGNRGASGVVITETVPANTTFNAGASTAGWICSPNNNAGSTCTLAIGALVAGGGNQTAIYAATVANPLPAGVSQISNTATIADDGTNGTDPTPGNNSGSDTTPITGAPDLSLTKSDGGASVAPGGTVAYTLTYANSGNRGATGVVITETVPANTTFNAGASTAGWICSPNNNAGSTCTLAIGTLVAGGGNLTATFTANVASPLAPSVTQISNTATIADDATNGTDPTPGNNTGSDTTPVTGADLSITKTDGVTVATPGGSVTYTITALNAGPGDTTGAMVTDTFPAALTCTWTCSGAGGGTCTAAASGNINDTVNLPLGSSVTYTAACTIAAGATGSLSNTATVATPVGVNDPTPGNNSATDTDTLTAQADVALTITDNHAIVEIGQSVNYIINVTNSAGPSTASATVTDVLPAGLADGSWVCIPFGGATCASGFGNTLSDTATLPVGGQTSYVYSATVVSGDSNDLLTNTASVALTSGTDPTPGNNSGSDTDLVVIFKDGFEGTPLMVPTEIGTGADYVTATLRVDANLLSALSIVPTAVASGRAADGKTLFTLELARFGHDIVLRALTKDDRGVSERSPWQIVDLDQHLLAFAWQSASGQSDGYFSVSGGSPLVMGDDGKSSPLTHLWVMVENGVPWLILIAH